MSGKFVGSEDRQIASYLTSSIWVRNFAVCQEFWNDCPVWKKQQLFYQKFHKWLHCKNHCIQHGLCQEFSLCQEFFLDSIHSKTLACQEFCSLSGTSEIEYTVKTLSGFWLFVRIFQSILIWKTVPCQEIRYACQEFC